MLISKLSKLTSFMIYGGTFLLSVLSFFTTYYGLTILLDKPLALMGSLGLQIAMLGIAWNLMKIRENRASYVIVFMLTALFSMFFSYANFDSSLKANTRATEARREYAEAARPVLNQLAQMTREGAVRGEYQVSRIAKLIELEEDKGWATVVDEGSRDEFVQSVIDGARLMVDSWKTRQGADYRQGKGRGIIADYLHSRRSQAEGLLTDLIEYQKLVDSISLAYSSEQPVEKQYGLVNRAFVEFPTSAYTALTADTKIIPSPPPQIEFIEKPLNRQQAFMLVIQDLLTFDYLAFFSLLLAVSIDLIVILMALAGSYALDDDEHVFNRVRTDANRRVKNIAEDDHDEFIKALKDNIRQFEEASEYGLQLQKVLEEYKTKKKNFKITLKGETETTNPRNTVSVVSARHESKNSEANQGPKKIVI
ncbi:MAG: hypothetical protein R3F48_10925 [Candidatus Zixiibacteriota bacterium]